MIIIYCYLCKTHISDIYKITGLIHKLQILIVTNSNFYINKYSLFIINILIFWLTIKYNNLKVLTNLHVQKKLKQIII